ncbi:MAG: MarR family EPS-associated transcriptional regulator [Proteobacteria bacterium]|nr:MarR family EPS-associated transcriptional regulator [Pseudomonadota bacterium]
MKADTVETDYRVLKILEKNPEISQRELAEQLGVNLGKTNYAIAALVERGLVKAENFRRSTNERGYASVLMPKGMRQ